MPRRHEPSRRRFLQAGLLGCAAAATADAAPDGPAVKPFELERNGDRRTPGRHEVGQVHRPLPRRALPRPHRGDRQAGAGRQRRDRAEPRRAGDRRRARQGAEGQGAARPAARRPRPRQGQHRHRRQDGDHRRLAGPGRRRSRRRTPSSSSGCARPAPSCSARRTSASGPTSAPTARPAAGAAAAA